jgi:hypothetical protein
MLTPVGPLSLLALLLACGPDPDGATLPAAWDPDLDPLRTASPDDAALASALRAVFDESPGWGAEAVLRAFDAAMVGANPTCPGFVAQGAAGGWIAECTNGVGTTYDGYLYTLSDGAGGRALWGAALLELADGTTMRLAGSADYRTAEGEGPDSGALVTRGQVRGTFRVTPAAGDTARWGWLAGGHDLSMTLERQVLPDGSRVVRLDGGVGGLREGALTAVDFMDTRVVPASIDCPAVEPSGSLALRDTVGDWYTVTFDAPPTGLAAGRGCDGCGVLTRPDGTTGTLCTDAAGALGEPS